MSDPALTDEDRANWLRLARTPRIGPVTFAQLLQRFGSAGAALEALPDLRNASGGASPKIPDRAAIDAEMEAIAG